eukprot:s675_g24.t1
MPQRFGRQVPERTGPPEMTALSQASIPAAFQRSAAQFGVAESDYLVLSSLGIHSYESFALRVHSKESLEEFLRDTVCPQAGYNDPGRGLILFNRTPAIGWQTFKMSDDAASLRKLWYMSKEICKSEMERLTSGEDASRVKVALPSAVAMETAAVNRGMATPVSDTERPSLFALTRLARSLLGPGASFEYVPWEAFLTMDEERRMERAGTLPKARGEVVLGNDKRLTLKEKDAMDAPAETTTDMETMRRRLDIRARAMEMLEVGKFQTYRALNDRYIGAVLAVPPEGMRSPTIQETRRFDRTLHQELLRWLSREVGTLDGGISYYLQNEQLSLWRLLDPVIQSLPDQGVEQKASSAKKRTREESPEKEPSPLPRRRQEEPKPKKKKKAKCLMCGKRHTPLCHMPEGYRRQIRAKAKAEGKGKPAAKKAAE